MKQIMRDVCIAALGINIALFAFGFMTGSPEAMWLALGSGAMCVLGIKLEKTIENKED